MWNGVRDMADMILSAQNKNNVSISGNKQPDHAKLKNLSFEESGHTGFQAALSDEQLKNLDNLTGKEDKANKIDDIFSNGSNRETYPSTRAVFDFGYATAIEIADSRKNEIISDRIPRTNDLFFFIKFVQSTFSFSFASLLLKNLLS